MGIVVYGPEFRGNDSRIVVYGFWDLDWRLWAGTEVEGSHNREWDA